MSVKDRYQRGRDVGGWCCDNCYRVWTHSVSRHRRRRHYYATFLRFAGHKFVNWYCRPFDWADKGTVDVAPMLTYIDGCTITMVRNPKPWRKP